jgi:hypothetical protein
MIFITAAAGTLMYPIPVETMMTATITAANRISWTAVASFKPILQSPFQIKKPFKLLRLEGLHPVFLALI